MSKVEKKIEELGLFLPAPLQMPEGVVLPFEMVRIVGERAIIAGHGPLNRDGSIAEPLGKVGKDVSAEQANHAAKLVALAMISSLRDALGDLDRITHWVKLLGMVNSEPGFTAQPAVINGCSDIILEVFGPEIGKHARSAVGMAELPFGMPVEIEAEVIFR